MTERPLRILQIATRLNIGGASQHVVSLGSRMDPERFVTRVVIGIPEAGEGDMLELRPDLRDAVAGRLTVLEGLRRSGQPLADLRALVGLRRAIRDFEPDIVHTHMSKAGTLGRMAAAIERVPIKVHTFHGTVFEGHFGPVAGRAIAWWERRLAATTDMFIAVSSGVARHIGQHGIHGHKIRVVGLGLDLGRLAEIPPLGDGVRRTVTLVARIAPVKDVPLFLEAVALLRTRLPGLQARVIGDGPERPSLEATGPPWVSWLGDIGDLVPIYESTDAVALSSRSEGSPVAMIEALAAGRPVAAVPVGGVPELLAGRPGAVLSVDRSPVALSAAIERTLTDPAIARGAENGRTAILEEFSTDRMIAEISEIYRELSAAYARRDG